MLKIYRGEVPMRGAIILTPIINKSSNDKEKILQTRHNLH